MLPDKTTEISKIDYSNMAAKKIKCIGYSTSVANKIVRRFKELYSVAEILNDDAYENFYIERDIIKSCNCITYVIYQNLGKYAYQLCRVNSVSLEKMQTAIDNMTKGIEGYAEFIRRKIDNGDYISSLDIEILTDHGYTALAESAEAARNKFLADRIKKEIQEQEARAAKEKKDEETRLKILSEKLEEAERSVINREKVMNAAVWEDKNQNKIILLLMRKHGINIPLKLQGWINNRLALIRPTGNKGDYTYSYYGSNGKGDSKTFKNYLSQLTDAIRTSYGITKNE